MVIFYQIFLKRSLEIVFAKNKNDHIEFEKYAIYSLSSLYGIEIQLDNVLKTRDRLLKILKSFYLERFKKDLINEIIQSAKYILKLI